MIRRIAIAILLLSASLAHAVTAGGGTITNYTLNSTNWTAHIFTSNGTFTVTAGGPVNYLIVAGGGGSGSYGGGGGGGVKHNMGSAGTNLAAGDYAIAVGAGGAGRPAGQTAVGQGGTGQVSTAFGLTAYGSGGGGGRRKDGFNAEPCDGGDGGSGGGAGSWGTATAERTYKGFSNTTSLGYNGGQSTVNNTDYGGGGGGAGGVGGNADNAGGNGGAGINMSSYVGTGVGALGWFAGGGAGGAYTANNKGTATAGGGQGGYRDAGDTAGTANTGGGGGGPGGSSLAGQKGGSGIVIIRYLAGGASAPVQYQFQPDMSRQENMATVEDL